jgi:signal peptidase II
VNNRKEVLIGIFVVFIVLFFDQYLKIWVKTHMTLSEQTAIAGTWFNLHFIENPGMAFGWKFWGDTGKVLLTIFRICAAVGITIYIHRLIKRGIPRLSLVFFSLILAGAVGNIIDSVFYGQLFTGSYPGTLAEFANGDGYAPYFKGSVVDMLYFPLIDTTWPDWVPFLKGKSFEFFRPVFNIADASITTGVLGMLLFQRSVFSKAPVAQEAAQAVETPDTQETEEVNNDQEVEGNTELGEDGV